MKKLALFVAVGLLAASPLVQAGDTDKKQDRRIDRLERKVHRLVENVTTYKTLHAFDADDRYIGPVTGTQHDGTGSQTVKIYVWELDAEVLLNWAHFPLGKTDDGYDSQDGFGQWEADSDHQFIFTETECRGELYINRNFFTWEGSSAQVLHPLFVNLGVIYHDQVYTWDGDPTKQLINIYSIDRQHSFGCKNWSELHPQIRQGNDTFFPNANVLHMVPLGPWPYKLPMTLELQ